jgi:hypothetical protein
MLPTFSGANAFNTGPPTTTAASTTADRPAWAEKWPPKTHPKLAHLARREGPGEGHDLVDDIGRIGRHWNMGELTGAGVISGHDAHLGVQRIEDPHFVQIHLPGVDPPSDNENGGVLGCVRRAEDVHRHLDDSSVELRSHYLAVEGDREVFRREEVLLELMLMGKRFLLIGQDREPGSSVCRERQECVAGVGVLLRQLAPLVAPTTGAVGVQVIDHCDEAVDLFFRDAEVHELGSPFAP